MKRPGSAEGNGLFASLGSSSKGVGGPAVLKPLAPPPSYTPPQVSPQFILIIDASSMFQLTDMHVLLQAERGPV